MWSLAKKLLKFLLIGTLIVILSFICSAATLLIPNPFVQYKIWAKGRCPENAASPIVKVTFVNRDIYIPVSHVENCRLVDVSRSYDYDPAYLSLSFNLPEFASLEKLQYSSADEITISFTGVRPDIKEIDPMLSPNLADPDSNASRNRALEWTKTGKGSDKYREPAQTTSGFTRYETKSEYWWAQDKYFLIREDGSIPFMAECLRRDVTIDGVNMIPPHRVTCHTEQRYLFENVSYSYRFNIRYLPDALEIDAAVHEFLTGLKSGQGLEKLISSEP